MTVKGGGIRKTEKEERGGCLCVPGEGWRGREGARCTGNAKEEGKTREKK